jgi:hypothetical protein
VISRKSTLILAEIISKRYWGKRYFGNNRIYSVDAQGFYDFLFEHDYPYWFCNLASSIHGNGDNLIAGTRNLKVFITKLHTGDSISQITPQWTIEQRIIQGQDLLERLCQDTLNSFLKSDKENDNLLKRSIELDGYLFVNGTLPKTEEEVLNIAEEVNLFNNLYTSLKLANPDTASHHLELSEDHYLNGRWDDSISNSRK